jgi:hypothetical protein
MMRTLRRIAQGAGIAAVLAGLGAATFPFWRRPCLTWGTTDDEAHRQLPGDDLLASPDIVSTRATAISAPPADVWPWLVQMGSGRGGAYTYDWVENLLGLDMHSADEIRPELQDLAVGARLPMGENAPAMVVEVLDPQRAMVARSEDGNWVWAFVLVPTPSGTRLISRNRITLPGRSTATRLAYELLMGPGSLVMEHKMLQGIAERAENHERSHHV